MMMGNEAVVRGAIYAGVRFFSGYPITPATEIAELMARELPKVGGVFFQAEDELAAINAAIGASWAGLKAMTATSGPGFSLMQEGIGYAFMTETPIVIVDVMRGGPSTGQPTKPSQQDVMQARYGSHGDYEVVALAPYSVGELYTLTVEAVNISEMLRIPVIVLSDEILAHMWERVRIPRDMPVISRKRPNVPPEEFGTFRPDSDLVPPMPRLGDGYAVLVERQTHDEYGYVVSDDPVRSAELLHRLIEKVRRRSREISRVEVVGDEDSRIAIMAYGSVARSALEAARMLRDRGVRVRVVRPITLWPFPEEALVAALNGVRMIFFPEMSLRGYAEFVRVLGIPVKPIPKVGGELHRPIEIVNEVLKVV